MFLENAKCPFILILEQKEDLSPNITQLKFNLKCCWVLVLLEGLGVIFFYWLVGFFPLKYIYFFSEHFHRIGIKSQES